jgi:DNA-binding Xre family transcriptional regulator
MSDAEKIKLDILLTKIGSELSLKFIDLKIDYLVLEQRTGMSRAKIKRIFCGTQDMKISELIKICEALRIEVKDLW